MTNVEESKETIRAYIRNWEILGVYDRNVMVFKLGLFVGMEAIIAFLRDGGEFGTEEFTNFLKDMRHITERSDEENDDRDNDKQVME